MNRARLAMAGAVIATLGATGCADDTEAMSKAGFVQAADAICAAADEKVEAAFQGFWDTYGDADLDDPAMADRFFTDLDLRVADAMPAVAQQIDDLRALAAPEGDGELIEGLLDDLETAVGEMQAMAAAGAAGDPEARAHFDGDDDSFADVNARARAYGLTECGNDGA